MTGKRLLNSNECRWLAAAHFAGAGVMLAALVFEDLPVSGIIAAALLGAASLWLGLWWKGQIQ
jgi:hypothetical protein